MNRDCVKVAVRHAGKIADCAILWKNKDLFAVVELKGGHRISASHVAQQIQGGVCLVDKLAGSQQIADFYPVLMYRGPDPTRALRGKLIEFRGLKRSIIPKRCGSRLSDII